jgi:hypothetical protein
MPIPARSPAFNPALATAPRHTSTVARQISSGSCSTQPGLGKDLWQFLLGGGDRAATGIEDDGARAGRTLIDGEDVFGSHGSIRACRYLAGISVFI